MKIIEEFTMFKIILDHFITFKNKISKMRTKIKRDNCQNEKLGEICLLSTFMKLLLMWNQN